MHNCDVQKALATAVVISSRFSVSDTGPDRLYGKKFHDLLHIVSYSVAVDQIVNTDLSNRLFLCEQLYIANCKEEGNTLKPYPQGSPQKSASKWCIIQ